MTKRKTIRKNREKLNPNDILFGDMTVSDLDEIAYMLFSTRMHNNLFDSHIPECYKHSKSGGVFSQEFMNFEKKKFGVTDSEG